MRTEQNVPFSLLSTLKVGGTAKRVMWPESAEEFIEALSQNTGPTLILGGGSNVLPREEPYDGTVYIPSFNVVTHEEQGARVLVTADAGVVWDELVSHAVHNGWWGIENLSSIPGTVGGAVVQNIGAYGAVLSETIISIEVYDRKEKCTKTVRKEGANFGYRMSMFKQQSNRFAILRATFALSVTPTPLLGYKDLRVHFKHNGAPPLHAVREAVQNIRAHKFPDLTRYGTAGSFFLNPVLEATEAEAFTQKYPAMPTFVLPEGGVKVPLAWILEHVVDAKKMRVGNVFVWPEQALVIATEPGATAYDVHELKKQLQKKVFEATQLKIYPEVCVL